MIRTIADRWGPSLAKKYWDKPARRDDGDIKDGGILYSAIDKGAMKDARLSLGMMALSGVTFSLVVLTMLGQPKSIINPVELFAALWFLSMATLSFLRFRSDIRSTQLVGMVHTAGMADDMFPDEVEDEEDEIEEYDEEDLEDAPEAEIVEEEDDTVVDFQKKKAAEGPGW